MQHVLLKMRAKAPWSFWFIILSVLQISGNSVWDIYVYIYYWPAPFRSSYFIGPYNLHYLLFSGIGALLCHHPCCFPSQSQTLFGIGVGNTRFWFYWFYLRWFLPLAYGLPSLHQGCYHLACMEPQLHFRKWMTFSI